MFAPVDCCCLEHESTVYGITTIEYWLMDDIVDDVGIINIAAENGCNTNVAHVQ
jgi:hypothetical protein